jgi:hypothetical protein
MTCGCMKQTGTQDNPSTLGASNGTPPIQVQTRITIDGKPAYSTLWVTGEGVAAAIAKGYLLAL